MAGFRLQGALVSFSPGLISTQPNIIPFQFNPETLTHAWKPARETAQGFGKASNPLAVAGQPEESFSFTLMMNAGDTIADGKPGAADLALVSGIYSRLAALELLLYPVSQAGSDLIQAVQQADALNKVLTKAKRPPTAVPDKQIPTVLFVWGPGRILPVRVMSLTITEKLFDAALNPTQAEMQISLSVLTPEELKHVTGPLRLIAQARLYLFAAAAAAAGPRQSGDCRQVCHRAAAAGITHEDNAKEIAMFFPGSRYEKQGTVMVQRADGSAVTAVKIPLPAESQPAGFHRRLRASGSTSSRSIT